MPVAAVMDNDTEQGRAISTTARLARVDVFQSLADAEAVWRAMERPGHLLTPFQRFDFLAAWQTHVGSLEGITPYIVAAYDSASRPLLLLPLGLRRESGARVASFLGGKHATFNMPLLEADFAATVSVADFNRLFDLLRETNSADLLALARQPARWLGVANPLTLLPSQPSVNNCPLLTLVPGTQPADRISNSFRRRLKGKERKLQPLAGYRYMIARSDDEIRRVIDAFFTIKPQRMAIQKLPNVFADPGIAPFIDSACHAPWGDGRTIEIHALECDDEVIAIFAGMADGHRFSMMFNTYTISPNAKYSPGLILLRNIIDHYADLNYTAIDLGIGSDDYKLLFCKDDEPIFDSFLPLTTRGGAAGLALSAMTRAKRMVKQTPALAEIAQRVRSVLHR